MYSLVTFLPLAASCDAGDPQASDGKFDFFSRDDLQAINVSGVPPPSLSLKVNFIVMLTRNLNFEQGLVNGQKSHF